MSDRIPPTPEDLAIVQRSIDRLARWMRAEDLPMLEYWRRWKIVMWGFLHDQTHFPQQRTRAPLTMQHVHRRWPVSRVLH